MQDLWRSPDDREVNSGMMRGLTVAQQPQIGRYHRPRVEGCTDCFEDNTLFLPMTYSFQHLSMIDDLVIMFNNKHSQWVSRI